MKIIIFGFLLFMAFCQILIIKYLETILHNTFQLYQLIKDIGDKKNGMYK